MADTRLHDGASKEVKRRRRPEPGKTFARSTRHHRHPHAGPPTSAKTSRQQHRRATTTHSSPAARAASASQIWPPARSTFPHLRQPKGPHPARSHHAHEYTAHEQGHEGRHPSAPALAESRSTRSALGSAVAAHWEPPPQHKGASAEKPTTETPRSQGRRSRRAAKAATPPHLRRPDPEALARDPRREPPTLHMGSRRGCAAEPGERAPPTTKEPRRRAANAPPPPSAPRA